MNSKTVPFISLTSIIFLLIILGCLNSDVVTFKIKSVVPLPGLKFETSLERSYTIGELRSMAGTRAKISSNQVFRIKSEIKNTGHYAKNGFFEIRYSTKNLRHIRPADLNEYSSISERSVENEYGEEIKVAKYRIGDLHRGYIEVDFIGYTQEIGGLTNTSGRTIIEHIEISIYDGATLLDTDDETIEICSSAGC